METIPEPKMVIYGLKCRCHQEDGVRYIGRTIQGAKNRLIGHRNEMNRGSRYPVHHWMKKHGPENIYYEILAVAKDFETLANLEVEFFEKMSESNDLLNIQRTHQGVFRPKHSEETKAKMSRSRMGHPTSEETRQKISQSNKGRSFHTVEQRAAASARMKQKFGENHNRVKLKELEVKEIIFLIWESFSNQQIADIYGVTRQAIHFIRTGKNWKHVDRPWGNQIPV